VEYRCVSGKRVLGVGNPTAYGPAIRVTDHERPPVGEAEDPPITPPSPDDDFVLDR